MLKTLWILIGIFAFFVFNATAGEKPIQQGTDAEKVSADCAKLCFQSVLKHLNREMEIQSCVVPKNLWFIPPLSDKKEDVLSATISSAAMSLDMEAARYLDIEYDDAKKPIFYNHDTRLYLVLMDMVTKKSNELEKKDQARLDRYQENFERIEGQGQKDCFGRVGILESGKDYVISVQRESIVFKNYLAEFKQAPEICWQHFWKARLRSGKVRELSLQRESLLRDIGAYLNENIFCAILIEDKPYIWWGYMESQDKSKHLGLANVEQLKPRKCTMGESFPLGWEDTAKAAGTLTTTKRLATRPITTCYMSETGNLGYDGFSVVPMPENIKMLVFDKPEINLDAVKEELEK